MTASSTREGSIDRVLAAVDHFRAGAAAGRVASGYIVAGSLNGDAPDFALQAISLLVCVSADKPCGTCRPCRAVLARTHADLLWVEPRNKSRRIDVEQMREVEARVFQTSYEGGWKAIVIAGADRIGIEAANAFLKTLEEPPPRTLFLLLTDHPQGLLPTIRSRCQRINLSSGHDELPGEWRETMLNILAAPAGASQAGGQAAAGRVLALLKEIRKGVAARVAEAAGDDARDEKKETVEARIDAQYKGLRAALLRQWVLWRRDILMVAGGVGDDALHFPERAARLRELAQGTTVRKALQAVQAVERAASMLECNTPEAAVLHGAFRH